MPISLSLIACVESFRRVFTPKHWEGLAALCVEYPVLVPMELIWLQPILQKAEWDSCSGLNGIRNCLSVNRKYMQ